MPGRAAVGESDVRRRRPPGVASFAGEASFAGKPSARAGSGRDLPAPGASRIVPWVLAVATVVLQIAYPVVSAGVRERLTIATVIAFAAASVTHAALHRGLRFGARLVVAGGGIGLVAEVLGVRTGVPFGRYAYTGDLGPDVLGVPVVIPLAWVMMAYPAAVVGGRIGRSTLARVIAAAAALAAWDLFLDPQMVAAGYWEWAQAGPALGGIPLTNYGGWLLVALLLQTAVVPGMPAAVDDRVPIALYVWTWLGSVVALGFFLDLPVSASTGGIAMGVVVLALALTRRR